jgi:hypothetical protein
MALKVSVQNKNTVQVAQIHTISRGIDLIHRFTLNKLLPKETKYGFDDFDSLFSIILD